jgi:predicted small lipoprotein YifL
MQNPNSRALRRSVLPWAALLMVVLAGCGQKGPLYLPEEDKPRQEKKGLLLWPDQAPSHRHG